MRNNCCEKNNEFNCGFGQDFCQNNSNWEWNKNESCNRPCQKKCCCFCLPIKICCQCHFGCNSNHNSGWDNNCCGSCHKQRSCGYNNESYEYDNNNQWRF